MSTDIWQMGLGLATGLAVGAVFFVGLRWTTRRLPSARRPVLLALGSFAVRTLLTVGAFAGLAMLSWQAAAVGLLGFVLARTAVVAAATSREAPADTKESG